MSTINNTKNLGLSYGWLTGESGWGQSVNTNFLILDSLVQGRFKSIINTPPDNSNIGDTYIIGSNPTGVFAGKTNYLAIYTSTGFIYSQPKLSWKLFNEETSHLMIYTSNGWVNESDNSVSYNIYKKEYIATCSSLSTETVKTATTIDGDFKLNTGQSVFVKFTNTNTLTAFTLNIDGTGAKPIYYSSTTIPVSIIQQNVLMHLVYDGTNYCIISSGAPQNTYQAVWTGICTDPSGSSTPVDPGELK